MADCRNHPDRPARAKGLCASCHQVQWRRRKAAAQDPKPPRDSLAWVDLDRLIRELDIPAPVGWQRRGRCAQPGFTVDMFPDSGGGLAKAKAECRRCPVQYQCLAYTLTLCGPSTDFGVVGATSARERRRLRHKVRDRRIEVAAA